jgi:hypothetical protein
MVQKEFDGSVGLHVIERLENVEHVYTKSGGKEQVDKIWILAMCCAQTPPLHNGADGVPSQRGGARNKSAADEEDNKHYNDRNQAIHEIINTKKDTRCVVCHLEWAQVRRLKNKIKAQGREEVAKGK